MGRAVDGDFQPGMHFEKVKIMNQHSFVRDIVTQLLQ